MNEVQKTQQQPLALAPEIVSKLVLKGDLSGLSDQQKVEYYSAFCNRLGLDPSTKPFAMMRLNGKEILYPDRGCAAQLNALHRITHTIISREKLDDCYVVTARANLPDGRATESIGAVSVAGLKGEALCNAMMKAETKSTRRSTLDLVGLGVVDESEIDYIPKSQKSIAFDTNGRATQTRVVEEAPAPEPKKEEPRKIDPETVNLANQLLNFAEAADKNPDDIIAFCKINGLISDEIKNVIEIPLGILKKLNSREWATKLSESWKAKEEAPAQEQTSQEAPAEDEFTQTGTLDEVSTKEGKKKNGQPWKRYGVGLNIGGESLMWFGTFSDTLGQKAESLKGQKATVKFERNAAGKMDLLGIEVAE